MNLTAAVQDVVAAADAAIGLVDQVALAQYVAIKSPEQLERVSLEGTDAAAKKKKEKEDMKQGLIEALTCKCLALSVDGSEVRVLTVHVSSPS